MRTVRDFVKTLCREGHTDEHVLTVTRHTRWKDREDEVKAFLQHRGDRWRAMGGRKPLDPKQVKGSFNFLAWKI